MKRILLLMLLIVVSQATFGQKLVIGDKMPDLKVKWLNDTPVIGDKMVFVEFFHSSNNNSAGRILELNTLAAKSENKTVVIIVVKEQDKEAQSLLLNGNVCYYVAVDTGNTFNAFGARYIPYAVIGDKKGRVIWLGNPVSLKSGELDALFNK